MRPIISIAFATYIAISASGCHGQDADSDEPSLAQRQREAAAAHFDKITYAKPEPFAAPSAQRAETAHPPKGVDGTPSMNPGTSQEP